MAGGAGGGGGDWGTLCCCGGGGEELPCPQAWEGGKSRPHVAAFRLPFCGNKAIGRGFFFQTPFHHVAFSPRPTVVGRVE